MASIIISMDSEGMVYAYAIAICVSVRRGGGYGMLWIRALDCWITHPRQFLKRKKYKYKVYIFYLIASVSLYHAP